LFWSTGENDMALSETAATRKDKTSGLGPMQHRHFATIATIIRDFTYHKLPASMLAEHFADQLGRTNPRFDRSRFLAACKPEASE
jgi:hypothetical protein